MPTEVKSSSQNKTIERNAQKCETIICKWGNALKDYHNKETEGRVLGDQEGKFATVVNNCQPESKLKT